jgi:hypothetical protein
MLLCVCGVSLGAQAPAPVTSVQAQIAAVEKAAASVPGLPANTPPRKCYILKPEQIVLPGASDHPASFDLSSGDFVARSISFGWDKTYEIGKIPLTPRHPDPSVKVRLDLSRIDPSGETRAFEFPMVNVTGGKPMFYATSPSFPSPGRWMIIATAGANWGCFVIDRPVKVTSTSAGR